MGREGIHVAFRRDIPGSVPVFWDFPPLFICWRMDRCFGRRPNLSIVVVFIISSVKVLLWGAF